MAYDVDLANRLREVLAGDAAVSERSMFGGLAFLIAGNLAVSASGRGGLLVRVDPARTAELSLQPSASRSVMRGRELDGWLHIDVDGSAPDDVLTRWVSVGLDYARSLPPK